MSGSLTAVFAQGEVCPRLTPDGGDDGTFRMSAAVFSPEVIEIMCAALEASINSLPEPVSATQVHCLAESILDAASRGERDVAVLERIALVEMRLLPRG
ncbi:hypothetical protein [Bradyrhizobium sp.]|uniref:hypothetical protein n=1 Tax=Bradyrhizobium sp. TaxID=376 RepID=UPI003BCDC8F8